MDYKKFYNEQADYLQFKSNPDKIKEYDIISEYKANALINECPKDHIFNNILEIGCAHGVLLNKISTKLGIENVYGLDISSNNIETGRKTFPNINFYCGTIEELIYDLPTQKFDLVVLSDIIEHIPDDSSFLKNVSKISNYVLINLPLEKCYIYRDRNYGETDPSGHLRSYSLSSGLKLIGNSGITIYNYSGVIDLKNCDYLHKKASKEFKGRVKNKSFYKKIKWYSLFVVREIALKIFPFIYRKIYGFNLFAFGKSTN